MRAMQRREEEAGNSTWPGLTVRSASGRVLAAPGVAVRIAKIRETRIVDVAGVGAGTKVPAPATVGFLVVDADVHSRDLLAPGAAPSERHPPVHWSANRTRMRQWLWCDLRCHR